MARRPTQEPHPRWSGNLVGTCLGPFINVSTEELWKEEYSWSLTLGQSGYRFHHRYAQCSAKALFLPSWSGVTSGLSRLFRIMKWGYFCPIKTIPELHTSLALLSSWWTESLRVMFYISLWRQSSKSLEAESEGTLSIAVPRSDVKMTSDLCVTKAHGSWERQWGYRSYGCLSVLWRLSSLHYNCVCCCLLYIWADTVSNTHFDFVNNCTTV